MPRFARLLVLFAVAALTPAALAAQNANAYVGRWSLEYERGRRMENGETTPIMGTGVLSVVTSGDSLLATLQSSARPDGTVPPPMTVGGHVTAEGLVFVHQQTAKLERNGEVMEQKVTLTWKLTASGDTISGVLLREMAAIMEPLPPSPVKGTRLTG